MPSQFCHKIFGVLGVKRDHEKVDDRLFSFETHNLHCQPLEGSRTPFRFYDHQFCIQMAHLRPPSVNWRF